MRLEFLSYGDGERIPDEFGGPVAGAAIKGRALAQAAWEGVYTLNPALVE